ncbi:MAG: alkaline phosphatase, partial [Flavobacteriaceae bacterium]|nr:alkaline phosphatase [Flavobacteriaceae bacterium]
FLEEDTLVLVTADHETGGLTLLDGSLEKHQINGHFSSQDHTATMVPIFAYGPGAEKFTGVYSNTELYKKIIKLF